MVERRILRAVFLIEKCRVAVKECPPPCVLADHPDVVVVHQQAGVGERLRESPVDLELAGCHLDAIIQRSLHAGMELEVLRDRVHTLAEPFELRLRDRGLNGST